MNYEEAMEWLEGKRTGCNLVSREPYETLEVRNAQYDAERTRQAYYVAKYWDERNGIS